MPYLQNRRSIAALALSAGVIVACLAKADPVTITLPPETAKLRASVLPGYATATQKCTICHSADYINYQPPGMNQAQWSGEAAKMQHAYGAPLDDDDVRRIGAYLAVAYGTAKITDATVIEADKPALALVASSKAATPSTKGDDAKALLSSNGCLGCHSVDKKIVGPAFHDVAAKYRGQPQAIEKVEASIHQGGTGKWGQIPMPPMQALNDAQLKALAEYVLKQ